MSTHDDGGPAFPVYDHHGNGQQFLAQIGMTLRDYFAAKAMQGFAADSDMNWSSVNQMAHVAYEWADAMLKARGGAQ